MSRVIRILKESTNSSSSSVSENGIPHVLQRFEDLVAKNFVEALPPYPLIIFYFTKISRRTGREPWAV